VTDEKVNILLVDDHPAKLLSYEVILKDLGEVLITANSAREALTHLLKTDIAIVLVDVCMPDIDGFELAAMIREHPRFEKIAIIFISAIYLTDLDRLKGYECGAVDYIPVPVVPEILRAKVRAFADLHRKTRQLERLNLELERRVEERVAELQEANEEIQSFAYILGHDLRAPLVNIMGFTSELQMLRDAIFKRLGEGEEVSAGERFDPKAAAAEFDEAIGFIKAATEKMERLINAILAISRAGKRELRPENIDMSALVNGVVSTLTHEAQAVRAEIEVGPLPSITCDRLALEQVFSNLLDNALKYLRPEAPGSIQVTGSAASGRVIYEVRDNGRGIAEADQKRIFEPFRRAGAQDQRGEGIGLAHVRALLRRLGGTIKLTSALNRGSTFEVVLPRFYTEH
jgi:signal transduction histidine kinase